MFQNENVEANLSFGLKQAKLKFVYEGKEYALRMTKEDFDSLVHNKHDKILMTGVVHEG